MISTLWPQAFSLSRSWAVIPYPYEFRPSAREIAGLLDVPLEVFFDPDRRTEETWIVKGEPIEVISYRWQGHNIWGATARILKHFTELVEEWQANPTLETTAAPSRLFLQTVCTGA